MGKPADAENPVTAAELAAAAADGDAAPPASVRRVVSIRCVLALLLGACVLLPAVFWLPIFRRSHRSVFVPDDPYSFSAKIQASFVLEKPVSLLSVNVKRLEYDILEEIGVPNSKVAIISIRPSALKNSTHVVFGVLPDPHSSLISTAALSVLRSSLIDLVLQQLNLSLTPSIFGYPSSFELLKFPGGITVIPVQSASIWEKTQSLFHFKLNNSIKQILENIDRLKDELKVGLNLRPYENVYVDITNAIGSTVAAPVIIQASVLSDTGNSNLLPDRLKQLAQLINGSHDHNLGLNHFVFGKVKEVRLSSYLKHSISSIAPGPSPSLSPSPSPSLPVSLSPSSPPSPSPLSSPPTHNFLNPTLPPNCLAPTDCHPSCRHCSCHSLSPSETPLAHVPLREKVPQPPLHRPYNGIIMGPAPAAAPVYSSLSPPVDYGASPTEGNRQRSPSSLPRKGIVGQSPAAAPVHSSSPPVGYGASPTEGNRQGSPSSSPRKGVVGRTPAAAPVRSSLPPAISFGSSATGGNIRGSPSMPPMHASSPISLSSISKSCEATWLFGLSSMLVLLVLSGTY